MVLLADCFAFLLSWRLVSSSSVQDSFKCPHDIHRDSFKGYALPGASKPCVTFIRKSNDLKFDLRFSTFYDIALNVCKNNFPGGSPLPLTYLDLDETRISYGRFRGAAQAGLEEVVDNEGHAIFLGWKITIFERGRRMVVVYGDRKTKIYRSTHPEIEDFFKRPDRNRYRRMYAKRSRFPACGVYNLTVKRIKPIRCNDIGWKNSFQSFICQSDGYKTCYREQLRSRCTYIERKKCCARTEYVVIRNSTVPNENCPEKEDKCDQRCDPALPYSLRWKEVGGFRFSPGEVCGNVTQRRYWIPSDMSGDWDCTEQPCCIEEIRVNLGSCPCQKVKCLHNGRCVNFNSTTFKCICTQKYTGPTCEDERIEEAEGEEEKEGKAKAGETFWQYSWPYLVGALGAGMGAAVPFCGYLGYLKGTYDIKISRALDNE